MAASVTTVEPMESDNKEIKELYTPGPNAIDISPNQDKGVLKEIITPGEGDDTPKCGNKVFVHYVGKLLDGTQFDSSRDRDTLFDFTLGKGNVIKAWDIGIATMKKNEKCILTCASEYAYGKSGSPPRIPADATLVFEVELFSWTLEDLSNKSDNGVQRSIIREGEGTDMPNDEATVEVHLTGKYKDQVFEDRDVSFQLGEGDDHGVVNGLEIALKNFKKGEISKIILAPAYAFGSKGKPEFNIPPESQVEYEVTLKSFEKAKDSWTMNISEKLEQCEFVKEKGTKYFKAENYEKATVQYKKISTYLQYESELEGKELDKRNALLLAAYLNLAACYLKLNDSQAVIENSNKALEIEPNNVKGLFRRGQARLAMKDFDLAEEDYKHLLEVEPYNKAAKNQIIICRQKLRQEQEDERKLYKNMFQKMFSSQENGLKVISNDNESKTGDADGVKSQSPEATNMEVKEPETATA